MYRNANFILGVVVTISMATSSSATSPSVTRPASEPVAKQADFLATLEQTIHTARAASHRLSNDRTELLDAAANQIASALRSHGEVELACICTHNSRRSHLTQIWATVAAAEAGIDGVRCVSGGTESTACNPRIIATLRRAGFAVAAEDATAGNPRYWLQFATDRPSLRLYSKRYDDATTTDHFVAMMCCSDADESCPVIPGAAARVPLHYTDPKISDGTEVEAATYDERRDQIAAEMFYVMRAVASSSFASRK